MAFQVGTRVDPKLAELDFSGFTNAAAIQAQALSDLGQKVGSGIGKYQENKAITSAALASLEGATAADPSILTALENAPEDIAKAYNRLQENPNKKDALMVGGFVDALRSTRSDMTERAMAAREAEIREAEFKMDQDKSAANIAKTKAETEEIGKLTMKQTLDLYNTKVGDVSFADYLQELMQAKAIKGGEIHQKGFFNFDEDQIASFDNIIRANPQFLEDMPQVVKDYYSTSSVPTEERDLPGGGKYKLKPL